jgi:uridine kinase
MTVKQINLFLQSHFTSLSNQDPLFVFITGASGVGKSHLAQALEEKLDPKFVSVEYFDRIGVPGFEDMIKEYGSCEKWQEVMTHKWVQRLSSRQDKNVVILEGQFNPQFAINACKEFGVSHYILILLHADKKTRDRRLIDQRAQPELANETMDHWTDFLRRKTQELGGTIIDTSESDVPSYLDKITDVIKEKLQKISLR